MIAGRFDKKSFLVDGEICLENSMGNKLLSPGACGIGYVTQHDYLLPFLTVRETLLFAAQLRLTDSSTKNCSKFIGCTEQEAHVNCCGVVDDVILDLGLKECADTCIGEDGISSRQRGVSGGEKRRVSVAIQIITDPEVSTFYSHRRSRHNHVLYGRFCVRMNLPVDWIALPHKQ